jgi:hypothetical protein
MRIEFIGTTGILACPISATRAFGDRHKYLESSSFDISHFPFFCNSVLVEHNFDCLVFNDK